MKDAFHRSSLSAKFKQELSCERYSNVRLSRDRLFGLWVAERLGKDIASAEAYASDIAAENFDNSGDIYMLYRVRADLIAAGVHIPMPELLAELSTAEGLARQGVLRPM
jgi:hypothetical protein